MLAASAIFMTAVAAAGTRSGSYVIELSNGTRVIALDAPVSRGTVVTFQDASDGALTGVPAEMVVRIVKNDGNGRVASRSRPLVGARSDVVTVRPQTTVLEPGEVLVLGPTGEGIAPSMADAISGSENANTDASASSGMGTGVGAYGGALNPNVVNPRVAVNPVNPNTTLVGTDGLARVPSSTDLSRAQAAQTPVGPNGFPVSSNGATTIIGPNGTPTLAPGVPGSGTMAIGPNGTPVISSGTTPTVIGPNGTPVTSAQPGSAQPVIGPNGTPILAPPGQPGSAQPVIGPNGTPVTAPAGQPGGPAPNSGTAAPGGS
jgi:hypothetical protein